jgi:hypothetical protein
MMALRRASKTIDEAEAVFEISTGFSFIRFGSS